MVDGSSWSMDGERISDIGYQISGGWRGGRRKEVKEYKSVRVKEWRKQGVVALDRKSPPSENEGGAPSSTW